MKRVVVNLSNLHPVNFIFQLIFLWLGVRIAIIFIGLDIYCFTVGFLKDNHILEPGKIPFEVYDEDENNESEGE